MLNILCVWQLPAQLRTELSEAGFTTGRSRIAQKVVSKDGTQKFLLQLHDGRLVETVGIPNDRDGRVTVCLSSQVQSTLPQSRERSLQIQCLQSIGPTLPRYPPRPLGAEIRLKGFLVCRMSAEAFFGPRSSFEETGTCCLLPVQR